MSETSCKTCKVKTSWSRGADITNEGYRCLSCSTLFYRQQNKRYREAFKSIVNIDSYFMHRMEEFNPLKAHELVDEIARKALEGEE